jgi:hypothetical protein
MNERKKRKEKEIEKIYGKIDDNKKRLENKKEEFEIDRKEMVEKKKENDDINKELKEEKINVEIYERKELVNEIEEDKRN